MSSNIIKKTRKIQSFHAIVFIITLAFSSMAMGLYLSHSLLYANFNQHFLSSKMFGVPVELQKKGIEPLYMTDTDTGWDGQFYYYIANDLMAKKDTLKHIDSDAYRYQRIGLPFLAKTLSFIFFQNWVSPFVYYLTSLLLILGATVVGASYFKEKNISPYWILVWSLGVGTQLTLLNGLPDAAADSLLIIALVCLMRERFGLYAIAAALSALSREGYIIIPCFISLVFFIAAIKEKKFIQQFCELKFYWLALPLLIFGIWQIYIRLHFGSPNAQATGVLVWPFQSIWHYVSLGLKHQYSSMETKGILLFVAMAILCIFRLIILLRDIVNNSFNYLLDESKKIIAISLGFITIISLYFCFGPTVITDYSGYMKAGNIFFFLFFFITALEANTLKKSIKVYALLVFFLLFTGFYFDLIFFKGRLLGAPVITSTQNVQKIVFVEHEPACLTQFDAKISVISTESKQQIQQTWFNQIFLSKQVIMQTKIINTGHETFSPYSGKGGVNASYHWVKADGSNEIVLDGIRTTLPYTLKPDDFVELPIFISFPSASGKYILKLSLVQEGCNWFYLANPKSATDIHYEIK